MNPQAQAEMAGPMVPREKTPIRLGERGAILTTLDEAWRYALMIIKSGMAPKGDTAETVLIKIQMGYELGLSPLQAVQNIAVINGRPSVYGDAALALVKASGLLTEFREWSEGDGEHIAALCHSLRIGATSPVVTRFGVDDAKRAKLWGKPGPWTEYWPRMLQFRARGFNLRDNFPDVLRGVLLTEEAQDYPEPSIPTVGVGAVLARLTEREEPSSEETADVPAVVESGPRTPPTAQVISAPAEVLGDLQARARVAMEGALIAAGKKADAGHVIVALSKESHRRFGGPYTGLSAEQLRELIASLIPGDEAR